MPIQAPLTLLLNHIQIGTITSYGYETPWACGRLESRDRGLQRRFTQVCEYLDCLETTPESCLEDDLTRDNELTRREITDDDVEIYWSGEWAIATENGELYLITPPQFDSDGFLTWRW